MAEKKNDDNILVRTATRLSEAWNALRGLKEMHPFSAQTQDPDFGFRRVSAMSDKELTPETWDRQMNIAHFLWRQNPVAFRIFELKADFVVGDGFTWEAPDAQETFDAIERHWDDPDNAWDMKQFDRAQELSIFGTWMMKPFVNSITGHVKLSAVAAGWIIDLIPDANNPSQVDIIVVNLPRTGRQEWKVIREDIEPLSPTFGYLMGDVFYFSVNKLSFTLRGSSDLFRLADWLDGMDQFLFAMMERVKFLNAWIWDVEIKGANQAVVNAKVKDIEKKPPKQGSVRVHNEKEKWTPLSPDINTAEVKELTDLIMTMVFGSAGVPPHWMGKSNDINRGTAAEMDTPTLRNLKRRQSFFNAAITFILQFQQDQGIIRDRIPKDQRGKFEVHSPDISVKDVQKLVTGVRDIVDALASGVENFFIARKDAAKIFAAQISELGIEVKAPDDEEMTKREQDQNDIDVTKNDADNARPFSKVPGDRSEPVPKPKPKEPAAV